MKKVRFTTWEKYQFLWIERHLGRELSDIEKCAIIVQFKWRPTT